MKRTAILGGGRVGQVLARRLEDVGHEVVVGAREQPGLAEAATSAPLVVNALPGAVALDVLGGLRAELAGRTLVDIANAVEIGPDGFASALRYSSGSLASRLQEALPETRVVKALNTVGPAELMVAPPAGASTFLCGDDLAAKTEVRAWLGDLGWRPLQVIDLGGVGLAWWPESFVLMVRSLVAALGPVPFALSVVVDDLTVG